MKFFILVVSVLVLGFTSCDVDKLETDVEETIVNSVEVTQTVEEDVVIPEIVTIGEQEPVIINVDTTEILEEINNTGGASLEEAFLGDTSIMIPEGFQENFDFLESIEVVISSGAFEGVTLASLEDIPEGTTVLELVLAEGTPDLVELIESGDFDIVINYSVDELLDNPLVIEFISDFLIDIDLDF